MSVTKEDVARLKGRGFLRNRGTDAFSGRVVTAGGVYSAEDLKIIAQCAENYGNGKVCFTSRLSAEITGIDFDKVEEAERFLAAHGLSFGGTGARVRPITACKGTVCVFGILDTQELARVLHERFYIGMQDVTMPHKFKIGVGGCPNSCMKPSLNDVGVEARMRYNNETKQAEKAKRPRSAYFSAARGARPAVTVRRFPLPLPPRRSRIPSLRSCFGTVKTATAVSASV